MKEDQDKKKNFVERMAGFIVDKRNGFFLMYIGLIIFSLVSTNWVSVNNDLTSYLPEETETRQGPVSYTHLDVYKRQFIHSIYVA